MYIKSSFRYLFWCIPFIIFNSIEIFAFSRLEQLGLIYLIILVIYITTLTLSLRDTYRNYKEQKDIISYGIRYQANVQQLIALDYEYSSSRYSHTWKTGYRIDCTVEDYFGNIKHYYSDILPRYLKHRVPKCVQVYSYLGRTYITWDKSIKGVKHPVSKTNKTELGKGYRLYLHFINQLYVVFFLVLFVIWIMERVGVFTF